MSPNSDVLPTSVLLIDGNDTDRKYFAAQLKGRSPDYQILEAPDGEAGLTLYRSRRIDCVVMASRPHVAVVMLTNRLQRGLGEIARQNGAYACFVKQFMSGEDLDRAIQRAMAFVGQMPKE